jgi:hypothetical protein
MEKLITLTLTEEQLELLTYAVNHLIVEDFFEENPHIEEEGSVSWYEEQLTSLEEKLY